MLHASGLMFHDTVGDKYKRVALFSKKFNVVKVFGGILAACYNNFIEQNTQDIVV